MTDIVPYTREEYEALGRAFAKAGIPSIGPGAGLSLAHVAEGIKKMIESRKDLTPQIIDVLNAHHARIMDVCLVEAFQQKAIIEAVEKAVKG